MSKIQWHTSAYQTVGPYRVPCVPDLEDGYHQGSGIKRNPRLKLLLKRSLWPLVKARNDLLVDGFIEWEIGKQIKKYITADSVFLEIGCRDMGLRKYVPETLWYNALDLEVSDFHVLRSLGSGRKINLVLASATNIPASSNSASLIVSAETLEHIPEVHRAIEEIYRIATPDSVFICSIPNQYCYKYARKGSHPEHVQSWSYRGFIECMNSHRFELVEGFMKGWWIPFPLWLTRRSYQLPLSPRSEYYNTNFFYVFRARKGRGGRR